MGWNHQLDDFGGTFFWLALPLKTRFPSSWFPINFCLSKKGGAEICFSGCGVMMFFPILQGAIIIKLLLDLNNKYRIHGTWYDMFSYLYHKNPPNTGRYTVYQYISYRFLYLTELSCRWNWYITKIPAAQRLWKKPTPENQTGLKKSLKAEALPIII